MRLSRNLPHMSAITVVTFAGPWLSTGMGQEPGAAGPAAPGVTGTGTAEHIAIWKNSTTLGSSQIS